MLKHNDPFSVVKPEYLETQDQCFRNSLAGEMRSFHRILVSHFFPMNEKIDFLRKQINNIMLFWSPNSQGKDMELNIILILL